MAIQFSQKAKTALMEAHLVKEAPKTRVAVAKNGSKPYSWPGIYKPYQHQVETAKFLAKNRRAFCFNEQGTGKTASAIWATDFLMTYGYIKKVLIVCPLSIMEVAWASDLFNVAMHRTVGVVHGSAQKRRRIIAQGAEYMVINYDGIKVMQDELMLAGIDCIIIDEANHYKNTKTKRFKALMSLVKQETCVWMMTGTPASQSPLDAYGLAKVINPSSVPPFFPQFRAKLMYRYADNRWEPKPTAKQHVYDILQPAIRYTKDECLDLPDMVYMTRDVELSTSQKAHYKDFVKKLTIETEMGEIKARSAAISINKLLQISAGAAYTLEEGMYAEFDISTRYKVLKEVIAESSKKVIVFVQFKSVAEVLYRYLEKDGITAGIIGGNVTLKDRKRLFDSFQTTPDPKVLLIQPKAAAHGVTLTAANTIVWWGPTYSTEDYTQANARIHRPPQTHKCTVIRLQGSNTEKRVYDKLDKRINVHMSIIELYKEILGIPLDI